MGTGALQKDSQFTVGEEKSINYVLAVLFFALAAYGIIEGALRGFVPVDYQNVILPFAAIPGIFCLRQAKSKRVYIRVNKDGIFKDERKVTGWADFLKAYITQDPNKRVTSIADKFQLVVEFRSPNNSGQGIRKRIPLTNTQNKSEEDIMEAIGFFVRLHKKEKAPGTTG